LLQYHIIDNDICAASVIEPVSLRTKEGQKVNLTCGGDDTISVNGVPVTDPDLLATNGVVHAVDKILVPDAGRSYQIWRIFL
jgi:transforming growth factor-beta-induced protein